MLQNTYLPEMRRHFDDFLAQTGVCEPLLDPQRSTQDAGYLSDVAHIKRFLELWDADQTFRDALAENPDVATRQRGLSVSGESLRILWDCGYAAGPDAASARISPAVARYRAFILEKLMYRDQLREEACVPQDPRHRAWRERQVNRCFSELGEQTARAIVHAPFTIELSKGCSVGCWFCGLESSRKEADFAYTPENARLWRDVLEALQTVIGPNASAGFLYWATDPLDNPDYERFCFDYAEILGKCPQTTTAQAQKHIERLRQFLKESFARGCEVNRFSVLSLKMLERIHAAFTPEELLHTELIAQNIESRSMLAKAGRAAGSKHLRRKAALLGFDVEEARRGTISCVSGFLLNMVERRVKLITPCTSSERWPHGHWVYEEAGFTSGAELETVLRGMIARHLPESLTHRDPIAFREDLRFALDGETFTLTSAQVRHSLREAPGIQAIGEQVAGGAHSAGEIAFLMEERHGIELSDTFILLNKLFQAGLLNEDPTFFSRKRDL